MGNNKEKTKKQFENGDEDQILLEEPAIAYGYGMSGERRYTYADYLTWIDGKSREIINGIARLFSAPRTNHAIVSNKIVVRLSEHISKNKGKCMVFSAPFDVRLPKNGEVANDKIYTVVQPDICVVCDLSKLDEFGCLGAPDLVAEIQSPSTAAYDMRDKFSAYQAAGVREYWLVFPEYKAITIYSLQKNGRYDKGKAYEFDAKVQSNVLQGLNMDLKELFKDMINR